MEHTVLTASRDRGFGDGLALMDALCEHAKCTSVKSLWARVSADNPDAVESHERTDFSRVAVLPEVNYELNIW